MLLLTQQSSAQKTTEFNSHSAGNFIKLKYLRRNAVYLLNIIKSPHGCLRRTKAAVDLVADLGLIYTEISWTLAKSLLNVGISFEDSYLDLLIFPVYITE